MLNSHWLKVAVISFIALQPRFSSAQSQQLHQRVNDAQVSTGTPPGLVKRVEPEYPPAVVLRHVSGRGRFRLTVNARNGEVDEVKILQSCGYTVLNELAAKALLQWRFQPGTRGPVEVPVEFYVKGNAGRVLHSGDSMGF